MNREIKQTNLYLLLPGKINNLAKLIIQNNGGTIRQAIDKIYKSETYKNLENEKTKFWTYGPVALYESLCAEK